MRPFLVPVIAVGVIASLAACGTTDEPHATVDARSYYDDYRSDERETAAQVNVDASGDGATADSAGEPVVPVWPSPTEDNVFVDSGDSPFVATTDDAESTFGLDVDTGSYRVALAQLDGGELPEPASIRVEEWINAFDYDDPLPADGTVGVTVETAMAPHADDGTQLVRVAVATTPTTADARPPANVTFVVDTSGSMDVRDRLGLVKASLALLVEHLRPDDTIAIVTYGDDATPVLAPTPVAEAERIIAAIDELGPGGSTNLEAGLLLGYEQARAAYREGGLNVVVLASDGVANVGSSDPAVLVEQIGDAGDAGIHLVTVGFGMGNYNDHLMEQLADQGDGFYSYVDTFEEAERLFVDELTPTLTVVARDAKAQVRFDSSTVHSYRLLGYENRQLDDSAFRDDTVDAGELGAGHTVTALYEIRPVDGAPADVQAVAAASRSFGEVTVRWIDPASGAAQERSATITPAGDGATGSSSLRLAATVAAVAEALRANAVAVERGVTLDDLAADAQALVDEDVPGAAELASVIAEIQSVG